MIRKIGVALCALLIVGVLIQILWYQIDGQPLDETLQYLSSSRYETEVRGDGSILFTPVTGNGHGMVIMHGALIKPISYANTAAYFAERGYTVLMPYGTLRLSILAVNRTAEWIRSSNIESWFFIGHSMGGMATLELEARDGIDAKAIALWAASIPGDYSDTPAPVLYIRGDNDGLLPNKRAEAAKKFLPADIREIVIEGANHKDFSMYSHQFFDNESRLGWQSQIGRANRETDAFFDDYH